MSYIPRLKKDYKDNATKAIMETHSLSPTWIMLSQNNFLITEIQCTT